MMRTVSLVRNTWRTLTSMGTALVLLFLLALASIPGALWPQRQVNPTTVAGYIADDPVTDYGVVPCSGTIRVAMYWTTALAKGPASDCAAAGWVCEGNKLIGPDAYASALGLSTWTKSPHKRHTPYLWPPEVASWLS